MRYGIVADTHDRVLPPLFEALAGVTEILHAGDVCYADALAEIETIAPVVAVHGNCDGWALVHRFPAETTIEREGVSIAILHGHQTGTGAVDQIATRFQGVTGLDLVVFGHSHRPCDARRGGIRFFNPGTAGGVGHSPSVGILTIADRRFELQHVPLHR